MLTFIGLVCGVILGIPVGRHFFGVIGVILGSVIGGFLGAVAGSLPGRFAQEQLFREMQKSSNEELRGKLEAPNWTFCETLALLNLHLRGADVQLYLPRVVALLESDDSLQRLYARDALRLVYTSTAKRLDDFGYNPSASTEDCRKNVAKLREHSI